MEDGVAPSSEAQTQSETPMGDYLDQLCIYYMGMGVSYDDFWHGNYCMLPFIEENYRNSVEHENRMLWIEGAYILNAVGVVLGNAFQKKGKKPLEYMKEPIEIFGKTEEERIAEQIKREKEMITHLNKMTREPKEIGNGGN